MPTLFPQDISSSAAARWTVLIAVSLTMFCGYFITDVMAPLQGLLTELFGWDNTDFGLFNSGYGWFNVFLLMLIFGGMALDKLGPRRTGVLALGVMLAGALIKYYAIGWMDSGQMSHFWFFGPRALKSQVLVASLGYALFAVGYEVVGITATKIIVRWFKGKELALALGLNVAFARAGTAVAVAAPIPLYNAFGSISLPILFGIVMLLIGLMTFGVFILFDRRLDAQRAQVGLADDEKFHVRDIVSIFRNRGFWYIALLCLLFYSAVFPFIKFAVGLMRTNFDVPENFAGLIITLLPLGTLLLTPLFGGLYDRKGRGASMMLIGALMLVVVYVGFLLPLFNHWAMGAVLMVILGIAFSLVPSAMWPSVPKIIPENKLGTAYALIFWVQNIGLAGVPLLIGWSLDRWGTPADAAAKALQKYDYTVPLCIFLALGLAAVFFALLLKRADKRMGYGLEEANIRH